MGAQKAMKKKKKIEDLTRKIQDDPLIELFNPLIVEIYQNAIPTYIITGIALEDFDFKKDCPLVIGCEDCKCKPKEMYTDD